MRLDRRQAEDTPSHDFTIATMPARNDFGVAVAIHGEAAGLGQDPEGGPEFALGAESPDTGVGEVGDTDRAVPPSADADGEVELAGPLPPATPLRQEANRFGLRLGAGRR